MRAAVDCAAERDPHADAPLAPVALHPRPLLLATPAREDHLGLQRGNFDNWTYQPSYMSSNTPWFFNGGRVRLFPNENVKLEAWIVNGWQAYGKFNEAASAVAAERVARAPRQPVFGYRHPRPAGPLPRPHRREIMFKYWDNPGGGFSKAAASLTVDAGCEWGGEGAL